MSFSNELTQLQTNDSKGFMVSPKAVSDYIGAAFNHEDLAEMERHYSQIEILCHQAAKAIESGNQRTRESAEDLQRSRKTVVA